MRPQDPVAGLSLSAVGLLALCHFAAFVDRAIPSVYAPLLKADFNLSDTQLGALQGPAFVVVYALGALLTGHSRNRLALAPVVAGCMVLWTLATLVFAVASTYETLLASRLVLGLGQAAFAPTALLVLTSGVSTDRLSRAISVFTTGSATGRSGALLAGGAILAALGAGGAPWGLEPWRAAVILICLPNFLLAWLLFRKIRGSGVVAVRQNGLGAALARILAHPGALGLHFLSAAMLILMIQAAAAWSPSILNRSLDLNPASSAILVGVVVLASAPLGHIGGGWLLDRRMAAGGGPVAVITGGAILAALGGLLLSSAFAPLPAVAGLALITAGGGGAALAALAGLQPLSGARLKGSVTSLYLAFVSVIGVGLGPLVTGVLSDTMFPDVRGLGVALASVVATGAALAILLALIGAAAWRRLAGQVRAEVA